MPAGGSRPCVPGCACGKHAKPKGAKSPNWIGDRITHKAMHQRVANVRGPARGHQCLFCAERGERRPALDWAQLEQTTGVDVADYVPLCRRCHALYDDPVARPAARRRAWLKAYWATLSDEQRAAVAERFGTRKLKEAQVRQIRELLTTGELAEQEIGARFGVSQTAVSRIKLGQTWAWLK